MHNITQYIQAPTKAIRRHHSC